MLFYNILVEQHFFLEMRMLKNMKKKLTVIFASLALCFVSAGCSMDWDSYWTVYTDIWDYYDFSYYFRSEISDDCYKHLELTDDEWDDFRDVFEDGTRHFYNKEQINDWFIARGFDVEQASIETSWFSIVDHGFVAIRDGDCVYTISK